MAKKDDLQFLTINQLSIITGCAYRTIKERLKELDPVQVENQRGIFYETKIAVRLILCGPESIEKMPSEASAVDVENAKLKAVQRQREEIKLQKELGNLVDLNLVFRSIKNQIAVVKKTLLEIPARYSPKLALEDNQDDCREILDNAIDEALGKLTDPSKYVLGEEIEDGEDG